MGKQYAQLTVEERAGPVPPAARLCYALANMDGKNRLYFGDNLKIPREYVPDPAGRDGPDLPRPAVQLQRHVSVSRRMLRKRAVRNPPRRSRRLRISVSRRTVEPRGGGRVQGNRRERPARGDYDSRHADPPNPGWKSR